jgi:hypothetical protein
MCMEQVDPATVVRAFVAAPTVGAALPDITY